MAQRNTVTWRGRVGQHVAYFGGDELAVRRLLRAVLGLGCVAIDIGADIGWYTQQMAQLVGAAGRVLAIEANPSLRAMLQRDLDRNRLRQVSMLAPGLANATDRADGAVPDIRNAPFAPGPVVATLTGEAVRLDRVVAAAGLVRLDLIRIDAESLSVLQSGKAAITRFRPHLVFRHACREADRTGGSTPLLADFFREQHYRLFALRRSWAERLPETRWPECATVWAAPL